MTLGLAVFVVALNVIALLVTVLLAGGSDG